MQMKTIKLLFLAAEASPFVKVGGLGDVAGSLPAALNKLLDSSGKSLLDVRLVLPYHGEVREKAKDIHIKTTFLVNYKNSLVPGIVLETSLDGIPTYLISGAPIPLNAPVYSTDNRVDGEKYIFFSIGVLEMLKSMDWKPDIIHANDWHTSIALYALINREEDPFYKNIHSVLTIHNLPFMGAGSDEVIASFGLPPSNDADLPNWARTIPLPLGISSADRVVAVSPNYAREITTPDFGCGLSDYLTRHSHKLSGILNGIDTTSWDPSVDPALFSNFSRKAMGNRHINKEGLLTKFHLNTNPSIPLVIAITRMDQQKGVDLAIEGMLRLLDTPWQLIMLGTGDPALEQTARLMESDFPERVRAIIRYDGTLARQMYAGADMILMPSRYEPCGLAQMIGMRYGCIPVARSTGGLLDTILDADSNKNGTGFLFDKSTSSSVAGGMQRAISAFFNAERWRQIQDRGMKMDFSWSESARQYLKLYQSEMKGQKHEN
jgi:starch synthase